MVAVLKDSFAALSGHYYKPDGTPAYRIVGANGKERDTTLRDARKLGLYPSVTTILQVVAKPGLVNWMIDQAVMAALTGTRLEGESDEAFIARVKLEAKEQAQKAADMGTTIHGQIERHYRGEKVDTAYVLFVEGVVAEVEKHFPGGGWSAERSFASPRGYGGKVDLHRPGIVIDFKGKDGDLSDVECYDEHFAQGAAYWRGLFADLRYTPVTANCFFSRTHPGFARMVVHTPEQYLKGRAIFDAAFSLWKAVKGYNP